MPRIVARSYPCAANSRRAAERIASRFGGEPAGRPARRTVPSAGLVDSLMPTSMQNSSIVDFCRAVAQNRLMMNSTDDEIGRGDRMPRGWRAGGPRPAGGAGAIGARASLAIGLLTSGVQATIEPRPLPLAVGAADAVAAPALAPLTARVAAMGGDSVAW